MFGAGQLTRWQERKAALLRRSAINRLALASESRDLRAIAAQVDLGIRLARVVRTGWELAAPLWSEPPASGKDAPERAGKLARAIKLLRLLARLWQAWH